MSKLSEAQMRRIKLIQREYVSSAPPAHKLNDAEFLRGSLCIAQNGLKDALALIDELNGRRALQEAGDTRAKKEQDR